MFEDVRKEDDKVTVGDPSKVADPYDKVDPTLDVKSALQGGRMKPVQPQVTASATMPQTRVGPLNPLTSLAQAEEWGRAPRRGRGMRMLLIIAGILVLAGGGMAAYFYFVTPPVQQPAAPLTNTNVVPTPTNNGQPSEGATTTPAPLPPTALIDADGDGLTDVEEQSLGTDPKVPDTDGDGITDRDEGKSFQTNPLKADSDNDGLSDRDELFVWSTDANNADTDGDTYLDGAEVQNGYNPKGPGKLPVEPPLATTTSPIQPAPTGPAVPLP